jgi:hypothetical protein
VGSILTGLTTGGWTLLAGWIFPSAITVGLFSFLVFPALEQLPLAHDLATLSPQARTVALALASVAIAVVLNGIQNPLYRVLEGYWPRSLWRARTNRQRQRKHQFQVAASAAKGTGLDYALLYERCQRYPADDTQIAPTRLGNAIRAFETYAYDRFRLDSQALWGELVAVVPDSVSATVDRARAGVDFFVSLTYLFAALGSVSLLTGALGHNDRLRLLAVGIIALVLTRVWYRLAVSTTDQWAASVQALVNLGRKPLAEALGYVLPGDVEAERELWRLVNRLVTREYDPRIAGRLAAFTSDSDTPRSAARPERPGTTPQSGHGSNDPAATVTHPS